MFGMKIYITDLCIRSPAIKLLSVLKYSQPKSWRHRQTIYSSQKYSTAELRCHLWEQLFLTGIFSSSIAMSSASANLRLTKIFFCWVLMSSSSSDVHITGLYCRIIAISLSSWLLYVIKFVWRVYNSLAAELRHNYSSAECLCQKSVAADVCLVLTMEAIAERKQNDEIGFDKMHVRQAWQYYHVPPKVMCHTLSLLSGWLTTMPCAALHISSNLCSAIIDGITEYAVLLARSRLR